MDETVLILCAQLAKLPKGQTYEFPRSAIAQFQLTKKQLGAVRSCARRLKIKYRIIEDAP